jgi:site-specific recombinase XerD
LTELKFDKTRQPTAKKARVIGLAPHQVSTSLAARPYDLRHAAVSTWLNAGADPAEVAARAGHSVAVLLKIYAKCVGGNRGDQPEDRRSTRS